MNYNEIPRLTPPEIQKAVGVESDRQKDFYKMLAYIVYTGASPAAVGFNNPKQFPSIEQAFPNLFEREEQQDWRIMKQRVEFFCKSEKAKIAITQENRTLVLLDTIISYSNYMLTFGFV